MIDDPKEELGASFGTCDLAETGSKASSDSLKPLQPLETFTQFRKDRDENVTICDQVSKSAQSTSWQINPIQDGRIKKRVLTD